jgi:hypothetical protein
VLDGAGGIVRSVASDAAPGVVDAVDVDPLGIEQVAEGCRSTSGFADEPVEQRQPFAGLAPDRRSTVACRIDLGGIQLVQEISPLDDSCDRISGASAEVVELAFTVASGQRVDEAHDLVVIDCGGEFGPGDAPLLDRVMEERHNHGSVAVGGDGGRNPAGMVDAEAAQFCDTTREDLRRKVVGVTGCDHD